ncbi:WHG domain-containing protein, partial [Blastococcus saxobsidens]
LADVPATDDPVRDLAALGAAYVAAAQADPFLYRAMFDAAADLEDPAAADATFGRLVEAAGRARAAGRFSDDADPVAVATRIWAAGHGLVLLVLTDVLPAQALAQHGPELTVAGCVGAGDDLRRCRTSVRRGWGAAPSAGASVPSSGG